MSRTFIADLGEHESIDQIYLVSEKQLRSNRNGNLYLQVRLADRTGSAVGMLWNANENLYASFENGDYLRVQGKSQVYNGSLQFILNRIDRVDESQVDESDFVTLGQQELDRLGNRLAEQLRAIRNFHLRSLGEAFLMDEQFMELFTQAPAGIKNHHAYRGGLLQHVVQLMELVAVVAPLYPQVDGELLLMGAFLHDIGKVRELNYERDLSYSDEGQLLGHLLIGSEMVEQKIREASELADEPFPEELRLRLKHMILSHHGEYEFGSPKLPMTLEALALHYLDTLDAKIHYADQIIQCDSNSESPWTTYQPNVGRKFYKGTSATTS